MVPRQAGCRLASEDLREHPSPGGPASMTDHDLHRDHYLILIEGGPPSNYSAWSPDLPGCVAVGDSLEEAEHEMRNAIAVHLDGLREDGLPIPEPSGPALSAERSAA